MGGIISAIGSFAGGGIKDLVLGVMDRIKLNPEERAKIQAQMDQNAFELQKMEMELKKQQQDYMTEEIKAASANIQAEANTGDPQVRRARPYFLYVMYIILLWNFVLLPFIQMAFKMTLAPINLPSDLYWLFGCGYLGYAGFRSLDKGGFQWNRK